MLIIKYDGGRGASMITMMRLSTLFRFRAKKDLKRFDTYTFIEQKRFFLLFYTDYCYSMIRSLRPGDMT